MSEWGLPGRAAGGSRLPLHQVLHISGGRDAPRQESARPAAAARRAKQGAHVRPSAGRRRHGQAAQAALPAAAHLARLADADVLLAELAGDHGADQARERVVEAVEVERGRDEGVEGGAARRLVTGRLQRDGRRDRLETDGDERDVNVN